MSQLHSSGCPYTNVLSDCNTHSINKTCLLNKLTMYYGIYYYHIISDRLFILWNTLQTSVNYCIHYKVCHKCTYTLCFVFQKFTLNFYCILKYILMCMYILCYVENFEQILTEIFKVTIIF